MQQYETANEASDQLESRYAGRILMNKLESLITLLIKKLVSATESGDHLAWMESQFSRLTAMSSTLENEMKVNYTITVWIKRERKKPIIASIDNLQDSVAAWNYITILLIKESRELRWSDKQKEKPQLVNNGTLSATTYWAKRQQWRGNIRCLKCDKFGHMVGNCKTNRQPPPCNFSRNRRPSTRKKQMKDQKEADEGTKSFHCTTKPCIVDKDVQQKGHHEQASKSNKRR